MPAPTNVQASQPADGNITISWSAPLTQAYSTYAYSIYGVSADNTIVSRDSAGGNVISTTISAVPGVVKYFMVAYGTHYDGIATFGAESTYSNYTNAAVQTPPAAPAFIQGVYDNNIPGGEVRLSWANSPNDENGFEIFRQNPGGFDAPFTLIGHTDADITTFIDKMFPRYLGSDLPLDRGWNYEVVAVNSAGESNGAYCSVAYDVAGPDITSDLLRMDADFVRQWNKLTYYQKVKMALAATSPSSGTNYWDITGFPERLSPAPQGTGAGDGTVTVASKVFDDQAVNYWLGGILYRCISEDVPYLASTYFLEAHTHIALVADTNTYGFNDCSEEKWAWFEAGDLGDVSLVEEPYWLIGVQLGPKNQHGLSWTCGPVGGND
jgi:hypothetical protein